MRVAYDKSAAKPTGYTMWLSARDTYDWATRPDAAWPCSDCKEHALRIEVDSNGMCDIAVDGVTIADYISNDELSAIVSDHLPKALRHLWPVWE